MGRTILSIAKEAAEREATAPAPVTLFGDNNRVARILRHAVKDTMREYLRATRWQGQSEFHSQWVFSLIPGRFAYPLPPDYLRMILNTEQRGGWPMGLIGPAQPDVWARWLSGAAAVTAPMGWRIKNNVLFLEPTPKAAELVVIEYITSFPVVQKVKEGDYDFSGTVPVATDPFVPRDGWIEPGTTFPQNPGQDYGEGGTPEQGWDQGAWSGDENDALKRVNPLSRARAHPMIRKPEFSSDEDMPAFEDDYLLSLGMTWRLQRALSLPYAEIAAEYESEMQVKIAEDAGGAREFRIGQKGDGYDALPLGDGRWMVS